MKNGIKKVKKSQNGLSAQYLASRRHQPMLLAVATLHQLAPRVLYFYAWRRDAQDSANLASRRRRQTQT